MHYDLVAFSLWLSVGVTLIIGAVQVAGWRHRLVIGGLIVVGSACILAALTFPLLAYYWPAISGFMSRAAASPSSWVSLLLFIAALILFSKPKAMPTAQSGEQTTLESTTKARLSIMESNVGKILERETTHISTPELRKALEAQIVEVQNSLARESKVREASINSVAQTAYKIGEKFHAVDLDLIFALNFAVDNVSIRVLNYILSESPLNGAKNVAEYDNPAERETRRRLFESYIRNVLGWLGPSLRAQEAAEVVKNAENEMENILMQTPPNQRPVNVDPLVLRQYTISELKCYNLVTFLEGLRSEIAGRLRASRLELVERKRLREVLKMESMT